MAPLRRLARRFLQPRRQNANPSLYGPFPDGVLSLFYADEKPPPPCAPRAIERSEAPDKGLPRDVKQSFDNDFGLIRILGNDLPPRHSRNQTMRAVERILHEEPPLEGATKIFLLNRIFNADVEKALIHMLEVAGVEYHRIPFEMNHYLRRHANYEGFPEAGFFRHPGYEAEHEFVQLDAKTWAIRSKILYAMNNNGARNAALDIGQKRFRWTLPFDGQTIFTEKSWSEIVESVGSSPSRRYLLFPLKRGDLLDEPQVGFRYDAAERFDETIPYGRRPKVDLLMRLGAPGPHEGWSRFLWDATFPNHSPDAGDYLNAGPVTRLGSGARVFDDGMLVPRTNSRMQGIIDHIRLLDRAGVEEAFSISRGGFYRPNLMMGSATESFDESILGRLAVAKEALRPWGRRTVVDKTGIAPSGLKNDYFSVAPYWWPEDLQRRNRDAGYRDGERVPGTELFRPGTERFDRQALYCLLNGVTLEWLTAGPHNSDALEDCVDWVDSWFGNTPTRITPHFDYAQVMEGSTGRKNGSVLIEMRDVVYFLDACVGLRSAGLFTTLQWDALTGWMGDFYKWVGSSPQALLEKTANNNLATNYFLIRLALARFLSDSGGVVDAFDEASVLLGAQLDAEGGQIFEASRSQPLHYSTFSLQLWFNFAALAHTCGLDVTTVSHGENRSLQGALRRHLELYQNGWQLSTEPAFDGNRIAVLKHFADALEGKAPQVIDADAAALGALEPHSAIPPGWTAAAVFHG